MLKLQEYQRLMMLKQQTLSRQHFYLKTKSQKETGIYLTKDCDGVPLLTLWETLEEECINSTYIQAMHKLHGNKSRKCIL